MVIGITGRAGSGKSTAAEILKKEYGADIINVDAFGHELHRKDTPSYKKIVSAFGAGILDGEGEIDRKKLGDIVFADGCELEKLNRITYDYLRDMTIEAAGIAGQAPVTVIDAALLIELGLNTLCDQVWFICSSRENSIKRLTSKGFSQTKARQILDRQKSDDFYKKFSSEIIENDGSFEELNKKIKNILKSV